MKTIKQSVFFKADPHDVYEALMDSRKHSQFTGDKAVISRKEGGTYKAYGDYIRGKNVKLVPDELIEQSWRSTDFEEDYFSTVIFRLEKVRGGTKLSFTHKGVPDDQYEDLKQGWKDFYWEPMKRMLEKDNE